MVTSFAYRRVNKYGGLQPCLECVIKHQVEVDAMALVDSGANIDIGIPWSVARNIGMAAGELVEITGSSGKFGARTARLDGIHIMDPGGGYSDAFRNIDAVILPRGVHLPYVILGRGMLLGRYDAGFSETDGTVTLSRR